MNSMCNQSYALSINEMKQLTDPNIKIVEYKDISKYKNIDTLLGKCGAFVCLYTNTVGKNCNQGICKPFKFGHWTLILRVHPKSVYEEGVIEFFDSYGAELDTQFRYMNPTFVKQHYDYTRTLSNYIGKCGYKCIYNKKPFQKTGEGVNTCGKHCIVRFQNRHLTLLQYTKRLLELCRENGVDADEMVSMLLC